MNLNELAEKMTTASNDELIAIVKSHRPSMTEYSFLIDTVDEQTADRLAHAMNIDRCDRIGDTSHETAPGAPKAWREHL
jgi:hypothetical protein